MSINRSKKQNHTFFMKLALMQAKQNLGNTNINPSVGCVVTKNNYLLNSSCTSINGRPHAESKALSFNKKKYTNSYMYVTMEPCSHYGKTPPCVKLIIKKGVKKVFFSIKDPDVRSFNKSTKIFKKNKVKVNNGILSKEISNFYRSYIKSKKKNLPFVTCKVAVSKDFYMINKKLKFITNNYSRGRVHLMRSENDCIITSATTVINDNPQLTCRINGLQNRSPARIILDRNLKVPLSSRIMNIKKKPKTIIFFNKNNINKIRLLKKRGIKLYRISLNEDGYLDLKKVLQQANSLNYSRIFLECGSKLSINFIKSKLVDDLKIFISDKLIASNGSGNIKNKLIPFLKGKKRNYKCVNLFGEKLLSYKMK